MNELSPGESQTLRSRSKDSSSESEREVPVSASAAPESGMTPDQIVQAILPLLTLLTGWLLARLSRKPK
jgi:hypothetical protein